MDLYTRTPAVPPLPGTKSIFSCGSCPDPSKAAVAYENPPTIRRAFFMYGENGRLCINRSTRATGVSQTKFATMRKPTETILVAEVDPNSPNNSGPAQSNVTGQYAVARHDNRGNFAMADGSSRSARTNEFWRNTTESNNATTPDKQGEWDLPRKMYWYPSDTTPN